jgi:ssDNA-binding Zn-finger/Zn-ribbon topoisomerase 1
MLTREFYVCTSVDDRRDGNKSKGCGHYQQLDRVTGPARPRLSAGSGDHQDDAIRLDPDRCHDHAVYLRTLSDDTILGDCNPASVFPIVREGKNRNGKYERCKGELEAEKLIKVDREILVISCEQCGRTYGILAGHFFPEILSFCRCKAREHPLFSSEELGANQFEDC